MPLQKYRSAEEIPPPPPRTPLDPENLAIVCALSEMCIKLSGRKPPPGLYKNRSLEEAHERLRRWDR